MSCLQFSDQGSRDNILLETDGSLCSLVPGGPVQIDLSSHSLHGFPPADLTHIALVITHCSAPSSHSLSSLTLLKNPRPNRSANRRLKR